MSYSSAGTSSRNNGMEGDVPANVPETVKTLSKLYLPKVNRSSGAVIDMWIKAKELDANTEYYIELLSKGIGKPKEEISKDIQRPKYFQAQEAIEYGIADKIIDSRDNAFDRRNYDEILSQSRAMRKGAGAGPQAAPSGFRPLLQFKMLYTWYLGEYMKGLNSSREELSALGMQLAVFICTPGTGYTSEESKLDYPSMLQKLNLIPTQSQRNNRLVV
uniref:ATP-dependent Clp protease proteolytic subunit n=1 Tax=Fagus sylvatica TaxID=28930 RepID=A0A2N9I2V8_FAGSY